MVVAYLRGQLKPDYPEGFRSRMREEAILGYIDAEMRHARLRDMSAVRAAFLPIAAKAGELCQDIMREVWDSHMRLAGHRELEPEKGLTDDRVKAIELYKTMALNGDFGPFVAAELGLKG